MAKIDAEGATTTNNSAINILNNATIKKLTLGIYGTGYGKIAIDGGEDGKVRINENNPGAGKIKQFDTSDRLQIGNNVLMKLLKRQYGDGPIEGVTDDTLKRMIGDDTEIWYTTDAQNGLQKIIHGKNVCKHADGVQTGHEDATCGKDGYTDYKCGYETKHGATNPSCDLTWQEVLKATGNHTYGEWTVKTPATCDGEGEDHRICSVCNKEETRKTDALGHQWREDHRTGNCGVAGDIYYVCERDPSHTKTEHVDATGNHNFNDWHQTKAPTCLEKGEEQHECTVCGKTETREVNKLDHVEELRGAKEPTCTEPGYTGDKWCTRGDHLLEKGHVIPATGHHWVDKGDGTHTCPDCGATEGQPVNTNSALELRVVDAEGMDQPFTVSQNGTLRTYTGAYDTATLTGDLNTLRYLQDHGAQTIQFVTNGQTSSFAINDLLAQGSGSEVFYLTHRGAEEPTLLLVEADHSELVKD